MGFNLGVALGGAAQGAETAWKLGQQYNKEKIANDTAQNNLDNQKGLQAAMANAPTAGADNTTAGPTGYTDSSGNAITPAAVAAMDPTVRAGMQRSGALNPQFSKYTQDDANQYTQNALARYGQAPAAGQYAYAMANAGHAVAQTTGQNQTNTVQSNVINAYKDGNDFTAQIGKQVESGDVSNAANSVISAAAAHGVGFTHFTDQTTGKPMIQLVDGTGRPQGQAYDFSDPKNVQLAAAAVGQQWGQKNVAQASPSLGTAQQSANAQTASAAAQTQNADTTSKLAPSEIMLRSAQGNQANAMASEAPSRIDANEAGATDSRARAGLTDAQAATAKQNNDMQATANEARAKFNALSDEDKSGPIGQSLMKQVSINEPGGVGARAMASMYGADRRTEQVANTNKTKTLLGAGGKPSSYVQDAANPNMWVNKQDPTQSVEYDNKGHVVKVNMKMPNGATASASGIPQATNKQGITAFQGHDGKWYPSQNEAASTYQQAGTPGTGTVSNPPLVHGQIPPPQAISSAGQPSPYPGLPNQ